MNNRQKRIICLILFVFICFLWSPMVSIAETEKQPSIKVGYYEDGDYMSKNQQEQYVGYNIEYLQEIAKQSGLQFEFVDAGSWNRAYEMLINGEIDLLPAVYFTEQRTEFMHFVTQPMCSIYTTLNVRMNDDRYDYEDYAAFSGMDVGIIQGGEDGERFKEFCAENEITLQIIEYDETGELLHALEDGTLDGVAITHLGKNSSFRSVAQFAPNPLYFAVTKGKPELLAEFNRTMNTILLSNPGYGSDLYDKYLAPSVNQKPVFTKDERCYLQQAQPLIVSYDPSFAPLSYQDKKTGDFKGVVADIFAFIAENSGLEFQFVPYTQAESLKLLQQGQIDILCISDGDYLWDSKNHINSTLYYLRTPTSMITRNNSKTLQVLALPEGYQLSEMMANNLVDGKVCYYPSINACLNAVRDGEADVTYMNTQVAGCFLNQVQYQELQDTVLGQYISELCVGVASSQDSRLFSIMNKCIQYLPVEQVDAYLVKNSVNMEDLNFFEFIERHIWIIVFSVCLILGVIILLISYNLRNALHSNRRIQDLLYKDELTGLNSINGFYQKWSEYATTQRIVRFALLYGDISQFKLINDNFGFAVGDQVLCQYSQILQEALHSQEICGRVSADNFVLLLEYHTWEQLMERLHKIVDQLDGWRKEDTKIPYKINFVFGVYLIDPADQTDIHQMMDFSNYAKRYAKSTPGSFAVQYDKQMRNQALLVQQLESGLEQALMMNEFEVYYQPKVSMTDGKVIGSEALIRWNHPQKGFLMPGLFIPAFEKNGMIKKVDFWLFSYVCETLHNWQEQGMELLPVSCNFSRLHFEEADFPEQICEIADRWEIPHRLLEIEITESALIEKSDVIEIMLSRLNVLGFQISIDDFGSGYSSLGQLQQLSADVLKLDRNFICHNIKERREQIVVEHIIHMAGQLGMTVICEGVENQFQADLLQQIGCQFAQGFYYYRPMQQKDFEKLIQH